MNSGAVVYTPSSFTERNYRDVLNVLERYSRMAYLPVTEPVHEQFSIHSKIGGLPYLRHEEDWPVCANCGKYMQLLLQLNMADFPEKKNSGLVQLFYCTSREPHCETEMRTCKPFSGGAVSRKIFIEGPPVKVTPRLDDIFDEYRIVSWKKKKDYPHFEEYKRLGIDLLIDDEVYELMEQREEGLPIAEDKLFGWPYWIESENYPYDRKTGSQMRLLFQLDAKDNFPGLFGESGIGYLTVSPDNLNEMAFGWTCS